MIVFDRTIRRGLERINKVDSSLLIVDATLFNDAVLAVLDVLDVPTIFISLAKPASTYLSMIEKNEINPEKIFFVDCSTQAIPSKIRTENVLFIQNPADLTSIGISVSQFLEVVPGKKAIIIDAVNTLKIYNNENTVLRFIQFLIRKVKLYNAKLVVIASRSKDDALIDKMVPFFDEVIQ